MRGEALLRQLEIVSAGEACVTTKALVRRTCQIHSVEDATKVMCPTTVNLGLRNTELAAFGHGVV
jgi:hypothetical protein